VAGTIASVGAGHVGLTTAACFAHLGHTVVCADIDEHKVRTLSEGRIPIHEDGLEAIVREELATGRLRFVLGAADLSHIEAAASEPASSLAHDSIVVTQVRRPRGYDRRIGHEFLNPAPAGAASPKTPAP
jgi:UDP-glucose 6-dehydrogenase